MQVNTLPRKKLSFSSEYCPRSQWKSSPVVPFICHFHWKVLLAQLAELSILKFLFLSLLYSS